MFYIIIASIWWGILLLRKNKESFEARMDLYKLEQKILASPDKSDIIVPKPNYDQLIQKYSRQNKMIFGETIFFLISIIVGTVFIYRAGIERLLLANRQKNFILAVSHELKSPLTSLKLILETFLNRNPTEEQSKILAESGIEEAIRLNKLIENMLMAAKSDNSQHIKSGSVSILPILNTIVTRYTTNYPNVRFLGEDENQEILVSGRKQEIDLILSNIIDNAVKYSPDDKMVTVQFEDSEEWFIVLVSDQGVGIKDAEKRNVFGRFYRIGQEETRTAPGVGLGLYVSNKLIRYMGGKIELADNFPSGCIFSLKFKKIKSD